MSLRSPLAQVSQGQSAGHTAARLTRRQKAAIIVRFLLNEGADVPLSDLPDALQATLTTQMGAMRYVDRATLVTVVSEFATELEGMGLTFPHGVAGAITALDGRISPQTAARLRKEAGVRQIGDPWEQVQRTDIDTLVPIILAESTEVAAVVLSKLDVTFAAKLLSKLPGDEARRITFAISRTGRVTPDAVDRIGFALAAQLDDCPPVAFDDEPVQRVGAILNSSSSALRDDVLSGLEENDGDFANQVRRAIFTFQHIPDRLGRTDVPQVIREIEQSALITGLAAAKSAGLDNVVDFLLENMSRRMADAIREEMEDRGAVKQGPGEEAMTEIVNAIRRLEASGGVTLATPEDQEEAA
ncbi:flagellar motor switch protein FliG [Roseovarius pelagicus]|uniref:Flagellar motor switch protein FliG n=1 Tax=Roseovarius pelagicus TaxID=2980108 RepID=A0ABY6D9D2_9RHOB|nr:FliG C-terminal domain-containing protein [Roseovarius pelagicus]UXX82754.1 flagellar motor switch protein FliG [Roseovarius pelagicus]